MKKIERYRPPYWMPVRRRSRREDRKTIARCKVTTPTRSSETTAAPNQSNLSKDAKSKLSYRMRSKMPLSVNKLSDG